LLTACNVVVGVCQRTEPEIEDVDIAMDLPTGFDKQQCFQNAFE